MPLASSSATQMRYAIETAFGVIPTTGTPRNLRITGDSFDFTVTKESSKELNSTRTISSVTATDASTSGGVQGELSYQEYDTLMAATLQSTWTVFGTNGVSGVASAVAYTATTLTASAATTGADAWTGLQKGQWFRVNHPGNANHGKILRVSPSVAPSATVLTLDANTPAAVVASAAGCTLQSSRLTHGTTQSSFTFERESSDIGQFLAYTGQTPSKMSVQVQSGALSTISFDFMGKSLSRANATQLTGAPAASFNYGIQSGVSGASTVIWENGAPLAGTYAKSITFDFDNALRVQGGIGTLGAVGIGAGTIASTVTMSMYFADGQLFDRFKANTNSSAIFSSLDELGNGYIFTLPVANITSWKVTNGAKDTDLMVDVTFTALRDASNATAALQKAVFIDRVGAAVTP